MLEIAKELCAVFQSVTPCTFKFFAGSLAFNDENRIAFASLTLRANPDIGTSALVRAPEPPCRFKFNVLWSVAFFENAAYALKHDEILVLREVGRCRSRYGYSSFLIVKLFSLYIHLKCTANREIPSPKSVGQVLCKLKDCQKLFNVLFCDHGRFTFLDKTLFR